MNVNTNGKTTLAPQVDGRTFSTVKKEWEDDASYKAMVDEIFQKRIKSKPRFSVGDMAVVTKLNPHHRGFELLEEFEVDSVDQGWAYRADGNCLPFSCLANITMDEKEKQALDAAAVGASKALEGVGLIMD